MAIICSISPRDPDDEIKRVARELGFDRAFDQPVKPYIPEARADLIEACDAVVVAHWEYQSYLIFTFIDRTRAVPITVVAYECDPHGRVEDWSSRVRFETRDASQAYAKLRFYLANDAAPLEFCESQIY